MSETTQTRQTDGRAGARRAGSARPAADIRVIGDPVLRERAARGHGVRPRACASCAKRMIRIMHDAPGRRLGGAAGRRRSSACSSTTSTTTRRCWSTPCSTSTPTRPRSPTRAVSACPASPCRSSAPCSVRVRGLDAHGEPVDFRAEGFEARVIQHEIDHLDGVLIVDRTEQERARRRPARAARARGRRLSRRPAAASEPHAVRLRRHSAVRRTRPRGARRARAARPSSLVTNPDRPRGRHGTPQPPPHQGGCAEGLGLPVLQPERLSRPGGAGALLALRARRASSSAPTARSCRQDVLDAVPRPSSCTPRWCRTGAAPRRSSARSWPARPSSASARSR